MGNRTQASGNGQIPATPLPNSLRRNSGWAPLHKATDATATQASKFIACNGRIPPIGAITANKAATTVFIRRVDTLIGGRKGLPYLLANRPATINGGVTTTTNCLCLKRHTCFFSAASFKNASITMSFYGWAPKGRS